MERNKLLLKMKNFKLITDSLIEVKDDSSIPKNIKEKLEEIIIILNGGIDSSIKINKALNILEDVADDSNLEAYTRTQILNVVSLLEKS